MNIDVSTNFKKQLPVIIVGSLTLIATLSWNDAIKALIDKYIPPEYKNSENAWFKVLYAFVLTSIVIIIISIIYAVSAVQNN